MHGTNFIRIADTRTMTECMKRSHYQRNGDIQAKELMWHGQVHLKLEILINSLTRLYVKKYEVTFFWWVMLKRTEIWYFANSDRQISITVRYPVLMEQAGGSLNCYFCLAWLALLVISGSQCSLLPLHHLHSDLGQGSKVSGIQAFICVPGEGTVSTPGCRCNT